MPEERYTIFVKRIEGRIERHGRDSLSEDCIRYEYFTALLEAEKLKSCDLLLEYFHPNLKFNKKGKRKIDCVLMDIANKPKEAIEFKLFPSRSNYAASVEGIGSIFADCYRLLNTNIPQKTIVLVSMGNMSKYINNPFNGFNFLFEESSSEKYIDAAFINSIKAKGFLKSIKEKTFPEFLPFAFYMKRVFLKTVYCCTLSVFNINIDINETL